MSWVFNFFFVYAAKFAIMLIRSTVIRHGGCSDGAQPAKIFHLLWKGPACPLVWRWRIAPQGSGWIPVGSHRGLRAVGAGIRLLGPGPGSWPALIALGQWPVQVAHCFHCEIIQSVAGCLILQSLSTLVGFTDLSQSHWMRISDRWAWTFNF